MEEYWIIGIGGSDMDNVETYRVLGTETQVKKHLLAKVADDKRICEEEGVADWDYGCETIEDIMEYRNGVLYAFGSYSSYHIDYTATPEMPVKMLSDKGSFIESGVVSC